MEDRCGDEWRAYRARTGMFLFRFGKAPVLVLAVLVLAGAAGPACAGEGLTWRSYAELGGGATTAGGEILPRASLEAGIFLGRVELGTYLHLVPLKFGNPDLIRQGAAVYGTSLGFSPDTGAGNPRPFVRLGLGGIVKDEADENGAFDGEGVEKSFCGILTLGADLPLGGRWSARLWGSYRLAPGTRTSRETLCRDSISAPRSGRPGGRRSGRLGGGAPGSGLSGSFLYRQGCTVPRASVYCPRKDIGVCLHQKIRPAIRRPGNPGPSG